MKKIARRNFLKLVGVSASIPILQSLPIASASATDLSDYPLLKDGIFDFENTDITQYVDDVQEVFGSEKDMIEEMLSSGELTPQDLKQHLLELAEQPSSVLVERGFSESQIAIIEEYDGIEDAFDYLYAPNERTGIARSSATVKFLYGLAGSGSRQKVTIAYDIKWSERPIYVGIDSFGIGWIAADSSSHQLATKTASAVGEVYATRSFQNTLPQSHRPFPLLHRRHSLHSSHGYGTRCFASLQKTKHNRCCRPLNDCPDQIPCEAARYLPRKASWEKECALHGKVLLPVP